jgi:hypothetical protein
VKLGDVRPKEQSMTLELADGRFVAAAVTEQQLEELSDVRVGEFGSSWLRASGIGRFDRAQQLQRVDEVTAIELLDPLDPRVQLEKLKGLREGWLDGEGLALSVDLLARVENWLEDYLSEDTPLPRLYPTPEGGVEAEWLIGRLDVSIEFDEAARIVEWHAMDLDTGKAEVKTIAFDDTAALAELGRTMARLTVRQSSGYEDENGGATP